MEKKARARQCPSCHGEGGYKDVILDDGSGPVEVCGFCSGTGEVVGKQFYEILGYLSGDAKRNRRTP